MSEVVVHRYASGGADHLETPFDAREESQGVCDALSADADFGSDGNRGQAITDVVNARQRQLEDAEGRTPAAHIETSRAARQRNVVGLPVGSCCCAEGRHTGEGSRFQAPGSSIIRAEE